MLFCWGRSFSFVLLQTSDEQPGDIFTNPWLQTEPYTCASKRQQPVEMSVAFFTWLELTSGVSGEEAHKFASFQPLNTIFHI